MVHLFINCCIGQRKHLWRPIPGTFLMLDLNSLSRKKEDRKLRSEVRNLGAMMRHWGVTFVTSVDLEYSPRTQSNYSSSTSIGFECLRQFLGNLAWDILTRGLQMAESMHSTYACTTMTHPSPVLLPLIFKLGFVLLRAGFVVINSLFSISMFMFLRLYPNNVIWHKVVFLELYVGDIPSNY